MTQFLIVALTTLPLVLVATHWREAQQLMAGSAAGERISGATDGRLSPSRFDEDNRALG